MSNNEQLVESAKAAESQLQEVREAAGKGYVWLPNATKVRPKPFVEMRTRMNRNQYAMFTDEEQTRKLLKSPEAGMHYHWARHPQYDPTGTAMRVSMGLYKYVLPSEIRADATPMFVNHKGTTGTMVGFGTLVLVKESDEAYQETHIGPQIDAIAQLSRIETEFEGKVEEDSGGRAKGTIERTVEQEEITP